LPCYHVTGWYDMYTDGQIEAFQAMQASCGNQKIIIAPIGHGDAVGTTHQGDLVYPDNAMVSEDDLTLLAIDWYARWLKGDTTGIMSDPPVLFYLTGDCDVADTNTWNRWVYSDQWPPVGMTYVPYYLGDGTLDTILPSTSGIDSFEYDPDDPCPTIGGREFIGLTTGYGPKDQSVIEGRSDVLIYTTPVLEDTLFVCGKLRMILYGASDRFDTDWAIRVTDVYPDGRSILMTDNILQARHRHGFDRVDSLIPGVPDSFNIDVWSIGHAFNAGHRIRLIVSSSNYPRFERNANNGGPFVVDDPFTMVATNSVYRTPEMASRLLLPVVPNTTFPVAESRIASRPEKITIMAYPNPFNSAVNISLSGGVGASNARTGQVGIEIYDISGRLVADLPVTNCGSPQFVPTPQIWQPEKSVGSGIYLVRARMGDNNITKRIVYLK
ncbi:CocE/NonD family hydrolase, partial [bacterium]|nr:CocE/NonD family hydrolase [bacterium]